MLTWAPYSARVRPITSCHHCQRRYQAGWSGMMSVRGPQQEVGSVFLLPLLLLLLLAISVVGNNCGCWGTNEVYVQYKPPVSGWFHHKRGFLFERRYTVDTATAETQMHHFQLRYMKRKGNWLLLEKKRGWNVLSKSNQNSTEQFIVSCPTGQCSCQTVKVEGSSCWSINGQYNKSYKNRKLPGNLNRTRPYDSNKRRSQCLLAELQQCLNNNKGRKIDDGCKQYIRPLMNSTKLMHKYEHYTYRKYYYNLIKADDHDFWLIVVGNTCGCWGTNQIYVHYKPPVSGWFHLSHRHNFLFERIYTVYAAEPQMHHFQLRYMVTKRNWLLLEKKYGKLVLIINTRRQYNKADEKFIISCPSGQCSCQKLQVRGSSCSRINGIFHRCERSNLINFILNESENKVYAVSYNTGPCPDQLIPDSRTWLRTDENFTENITVTCTTWDNPFDE